MSAPADIASAREAGTAAASPLCLRVFGGRLDGAEQMLDGGSVRVGHGFDNDFVLRGRGTKDLALHIRLEDGGATVKLLSGAASLLGCPLTPGATAVLPPFVPLAVGPYAIAIGEPGSPRWAEVPRLLATAAQPAAAPEPAEAGDGEAEATPSKSKAWAGWLQTERAAIGRRVPAVGPGALLAASAALLLLAFAGPAMEMVEGAMTTPATVAGNLHAAGYGDLQVREDPVAGGLVVEGRVADERALEALRRFVNGRYDRVALNVSTLAATAAAVTDFLQAQGVDAQAQPGRTGLVVRTEYLPRDRMAALEAQIRRELPGTGPLRFVLDEKRGPRDLQYFFASEKYGLASFIDGDPGHIVTADGQYWFAGATLPTGHKLLSVGNGEIRFERDGLVESLRVAPVAAAPAPAPNAQTSTPATSSPQTMAGLVAPATRSRT